MACNSIGHPWYGRLITSVPAAHGSVISFTCNTGYERLVEEDVKCHYGQLKAASDLTGQTLLYTGLCVQRKL